MGNVSFRWDKTKLNAMQKRAMQGLVKMGYQIVNRAKRRAPIAEGNLYNSIRVEDHPNELYVDVVAGGVHGGINVPYAYRREYENKLHPSTKHYMRNSLVDEMKSDWQENLRRVI